MDREHGICPDEYDRFDMFDGFEDPDKWEEALRVAFIEAESDKELAEILRACFLSEDIETSFDNFRKSSIPGAVARLLQRLDINQESAVADIGCGRGHLAYALSKLGFSNLTAMDPNGQWFTGTGYLKSLDDHNIAIENDLAAWRTKVGVFDAVVSSGTVHHWQHIPKVAIQTRCSLKPGGYWLMISEWFANSSRDFVSMMNSHPTATRYNSYEWAYPASVYADLIQVSGFSLVGVVPQRYNGNEFIGDKSANDEVLTKWVDENLLSANGTVEAFWSEIDLFRRTNAGDAVFRNPQILIFQRVGL